MPKINSYDSAELRLTDYIIGTDSNNENATRSYLASEVANTIIASLGIGTVTSISTASSQFISFTANPAPITVAGTLTAALLAGGVADATTFLKGDNTWGLPGPTPNQVSVSFTDIDTGVTTDLTSNVSSIDFKENVIASAADLNVSVDMGGSTSSVDSVLAGTAISVVNTAGSVEISNDGLLLARAGGNITLSGGTGNVTVNAPTNAGTVIGINPGLGIDTIVNSSSNPEIDLDFTGINNYISRSENIEVMDPEDSVEFHNYATQNVKGVEIGRIPNNMFTIVKKYIDDNDIDRLTNVTDDKLTTAKAINMVSCSIAQHQALVANNTVDPNTLYFIIGAGTSYTQTLNRSVSVSGGGNYNISGSSTSVTGPIGTSYSFSSNISAAAGSTLNSSNTPINTSGTIALNGGTTTHNIVANITLIPDDSVRVIYTLNRAGNLNSFSSVLSYGGNASGNTFPTDGSYSTTAIAGSFNSTVAIDSANTGIYEIYQGNTNVTANYSETPSFQNETVGVSATLSGTVRLITYTITQPVTQGVTFTGNPVANINDMVINSLGNQTATGNVGDTVSFTVTTAANAGFTFSGPATTTRNHVITAAGGSETIAVINIVGTLNRTAIPTYNMILQYTNNITGGTEGTEYTLNPSTASLAPPDGSASPGVGAFGVVAGNAYSVNPSPTMTLASGYFFGTGFSASTTAGSNPMVGSSMPAANSITDQTLTAVISTNNYIKTVVAAVVQQTSAITYNTAFTAAGITRNVITTNTQSITKNNGNPGITGVVVTVTRTAGGSSPTYAQGSGQILWKRISGGTTTTLNSVSINPGYAVNSSYTVPNVGNGDTIRIEITESP